MGLLSELEPGLTGLDQLRAMSESMRQPPSHETLAIALVWAERGFVIVEAAPGGRHLNPAGIVHGGYIATILYTACGCASHSALAPNTWVSTLELKVSYHRPVTTKTGKVRAEGCLLSISQRTAFSEAKLMDESGNLLASATSSLIVTPLRVAVSPQAPVSPVFRSCQSQHSHTSGRMDAGATFP
jgi:uncharacterized protein (TIGR00369 family)